ncbi:hypothetical protein X777_10435, partial [Ooceraea biroi]
YKKSAKYTRLKFFHIITRELGIEKLKVRWGIRAKRFEEKIRKREDKDWIKMYWMEKKRKGWADQFGRERERYYNRNGWGILANELSCSEGSSLEKDLEEEKIREAKYNKIYKEIRWAGVSPRYLRQENIVRKGFGAGIRALVRVRCGNMEEYNKYWVERGGKEMSDVEWMKILWNIFVEARLKRIRDEELSGMKDKVLRTFWKEKKAEEQRKEKDK